MLRKPFIFLLVSLDMFLCSAFHSCIYHVRLAILVNIQSFDSKEVGVMTDNLRVHRAESALAE